MSEKYLRVYKMMDVKNVQEHLLIMGALSGSCAKCKAVDVKLDQEKCPGCSTEFKFIAFMNVRDHMPKMMKIKASRPNITFVDHDDFKRQLGALKAQEFLK